LIGPSTAYRGASAEVIEERITQVIERQVAGIQGIDRVTVRPRATALAHHHHLHLRPRSRRGRQRRARRRQPRDQQLPTRRTRRRSPRPTPTPRRSSFSTSSTTLNRLQLADYADRYLVERMSTIPGVAQANLSAQIYAMRIWLDANAMAARGVTVDDVETALNAQNLELPAGALESVQSKDFTIRVNRSYATPEDFARLPVPRAATSPAPAAAPTAQRR
jgi:multidrug efflux pump